MKSQRSVVDSRFANGRPNRVRSRSFWPLASGLWLLPVGLWPLLLAIGGCASPGTPAPAAPTASPLPSVTDTARELTADQQVLQVLNRLAFGPRAGDVARVRQIGVDRWLAGQLDPQGIEDRATDDFVAHFPTYRETIAQLAGDYPAPAKVVADRRAPGDTGRRTISPGDSMARKTAQRRLARVGAELQMVKVGRAEISNRQLQEVMVDFWENHFTVYDRKGQQMRYYLTDFDRDVIRPYALGRFRDLLGAVAKSPAMLFYLDNWESVADSTEPTLVARPDQRSGRLAARRFTAAAAPRRRARGLNENYGRELLELHTLGVDGGYSQQDVINVARALTGWSIERPQAGGGFVFRPQFHDAGEKVVLGVRLPAGRGVEDGEDVLDIVARHPSTARYIAAKLCRRLVSDSPPPALVDRAAATFSRTDGDIRQVLWTIVTSPEFYSRVAYRSKVKSPFEVVVSALRAVNAAPDTTPRTAQLVARMGEPIFGHQAPNGYPETGESWMNTGAILNRINFGLAVAAQRIPGASLDRWPDAHALIDAPRATQVDSVVASILGGDVSPDTRAVLLSGEHPLLALGGPADSAADATEAVPMAGEASAAASPMTADAGDSAGGQQARPDQGGADRPGGRRGGLGRIPPLQGLAQVVGLALGAPEFQRR